MVHCINMVASGWGGGISQAKPLLSAYRAVRDFIGYAQRLHEALVIDRRARIPCNASEPQRAYMAVRSRKRWERRGTAAWDTKSNQVIAV